MISCKILFKNPFNSFSYFFITLKKIKIKSSECPKSIRNYEKKNNTWNIRRLVDELFVPATQRPSDPAYYIEDCRISDALNQVRAECFDFYRMMK